MPLSLKSPSLPSSITACTKHIYSQTQSRSLSASSRQNSSGRVTRARSQLYRWLGQQGAIFRDPADGHTNYLSAYTPDGQLRRVIEAARDKKAEKKAARDANPNAIIPDAEESGVKKAIPPETTRDLRPFPLNPQFVSQSVLSREAKEKIWEAVMVDGMSVRDASSSFSVEMSRVAAVVRLLEIEKEWTRIKKPLARAYSNAVMNMLPISKFEPDEQRRIAEGIPPHESINDLPIHPATGPQIFHPTSESRVFSRADAAKVFHERLLPADDRVPHPELTIQHKEFTVGLTKEEIRKNQEERDAEAEVIRMRKERRKKAGVVKTIDTSRWAFKFTDINVDKAGKDGRGAQGVGWRYGKPLMDRKRGQVKIPTSVDL